jgi:hypothetical protein
MGAAPVFQPEPEPRTTPQAQDEAAQFAARALQRGDTVQTHLHRGGLVVFWVALAILLSMLVVWAWHIITPDRYHFLNESASDRLQTILVSVLGSSFVSGAARRWINPKQDSDNQTNP